MSRCRMALRWRRLFAGVLVIAVVGCSGPASEPTPQSPPNDDLERRKNVHRVEATPLKVGDRFPWLEAKGWFNGDPARPGSTGVKLIVVDLWSRWCPNCAFSAPGLERIYEKYAPQGVAFVSATNLAEPYALAYTRQYNIKWPSGHGLTSEMMAALGVTSGMHGPPEYELAPTLYLVDPNGIVVWYDDRGRYHHLDPAIWEQNVDAAIAAALSGTTIPKK